MKIALVIDHFHPSKGGAERSLEEILSALQARKHQIQLIAISWEPSLAPWIQTHRVHVPAWPRWRRDRIFANRARNVWQELKPDLVLGVRHVPGVDIFLARNGLYRESLKATELAKPSWWRTLTKGLLPKHRVLLQLERELFQTGQSPLVIAPSELVRRACIENYSVPRDRTLVIPNGVDLERFIPLQESARTELRLRHDIAGQTVFLFAANNFRLKGLDALLRAWALMDPAKTILLIAGRDRAQISSARLANVRFLGHQADPRALYQMADVLVHPTFSDTFGRVILEALATGLPVITTECAGAAELITNGQEGFVLESPRDVRGLAEKMKILSDASVRNEFSRAARQLAEAHPKAVFLERTAEAIEQEGRRIGETR